MPFVKKTYGSVINSKSHDRSDWSFSKLSCVSGPLLRLACTTRNVLLTTMGWKICSSGCYFLFPATDQFPRLVPFRALAIVSSVVPLTGRTLEDIGCAVVYTVVARALGAGFLVRAPVCFVVVLLTFAASQWTLTLIEAISKNCFPVHMGNAAAEQCFCVRLFREVDGHRFVSFLSTQPDDLLDLRNAVLILKVTCKILTVPPRHSENTFFLDVIQFNREPLFAL